MILGTIKCCSFLVSCLGSPSAPQGWLQWETGVQGVGSGWWPFIPKSMGLGLPLSCGTWDLESDMVLDHSGLEHTV